MKFGDVDSAGLVNIDILEAFYESYCKDPDSVDPSWKVFFTDALKESDSQNETLPQTEDSKKHLKKKSKSQKNGRGESSFRTVYVSTDVGDSRIFNLIEAYRTYGHLIADVNPINPKPIEMPHELLLETLGFTESDLKVSFPTCGLLKKIEKAPLQEIIDTLKQIYCEKIGVEYMGMQQRELESFIQEKIEPNRFKVSLPMGQKQMILQHLNKSELFESFLHTKYVGQKRFSIEGGETLIPILATIIENGADVGIQEFVLGMAHRGRLNVLTNIMNKSYAEIFGEFDDSFIPGTVEGGGDVKYHKGYSSKIKTHKEKEVQVDLVSNPSHLEAVSSVVEGLVRARQVLIGDDKEKSRVIPILIHGDASLAGQGIVYEVMQMCNLPGYSTGGTIHVVVNNQIGFTTLPKDSRSTRYCTDLARTFGAPVFHVNAEDPEGCVFVTNLALEIRQKFHLDVFIDLNCYRKFGHNEGDEPAFTQPLEYKLISQKRPIREIYRDQLITQGVLEKYMAETLEDKFKKALDRALKGIKVTQGDTKKNGNSENHEISADLLFEVMETGVPLEELQQIARASSVIPEDFSLHKKLEKLLTDRLKMVEAAPNNQPVDWGMAELLAFGSLLSGGTHVRLSGQDSRRGTFSHRHATWFDQKNAKKYFPLSNLKKHQGRFDVFNSPLSEYGVLGFEHGYSLGDPEALVIWEAQFGDFCNGAQIIIDQFISTSEQKWNTTSRLSLFLPHGYEGQGPEHSSARVERFLSLCGKFNMQVCNATTPSQLFHLVRRQALRKVRKPLILFTPKGLLRHPACISDIKTLTQGSFQEVLDDPSPPKNVKRLVLCTGRIFYDLLEGREKNPPSDMAIIRIEQLYPFNFNKLSEIIKKYPDVKECYWVQEEPSNMGAWKFIQPRLIEIFKNIKVSYIGRPPNASPAVGSHNAFKKQHGQLMSAVFKAEAQPFYELGQDFRG